jgi:recombination protein RecT
MHVFAVAITARQRNPQLIECTDISVLRCAILSAQFGLDVSGIGGKAYMIPYWNKDAVVGDRKGAMEARFQFGYRGLIELAMRTGRFVAIKAREVYEGEPFQYEDGLQEKLFHIPGALPDAPVVAAWAVAVHTTGYRQPEVLFQHQIEARRAVSQAADGPAWKNWYPEMAKKTVLRAICKKLPDSPELANALDIEDRSDLGLGPAAEVELEKVEEHEPPAPPPSRTEQVKEKVRGSRKERAAAEEEPPPPDHEPDEEP